MLEVYSGDPGALHDKDMIEPVDSLTFTYYDEDGEDPANPSEVRAILITLVILDSDDKVPPVTFSSMAMVREDVAAAADEGFTFSKNSDFSTEDFAFTTDDTFYIKIWTNQVDYTDIKNAKYQLKKGKTKLNYDLDNNMDITYTDDVDLSGFATGTWEVKDMKIEDNDRNKYEPGDSQITIASP